MFLSGFCLLFRQNPQSMPNADSGKKTIGVSENIVKHGRQFGIDISKPRLLKDLKRSLR